MSRSGGRSGPAPVRRHGHAGGDPGLVDAPVRRVRGVGAPLVALTGIDDLVVVATRDAVLVMRKGQAQNVRDVVDAARNADKLAFVYFDGQTTRRLGLAGDDQVVALASIAGVDDQVAEAGSHRDHLGGDDDHPRDADRDPQGGHELGVGRPDDGARRRREAGGGPGG